MKKRKSKQQMLEKPELTHCKRCSELGPVTDKRCIIFFGDKSNVSGNAIWLCPDCYDTVEYSASSLSCGDPDSIKDVQKLYKSDKKEST